MERKDQISGGFCFLISLIVVQQALTMSLGTIRNPGPGFVPLIWGVSLGILSCGIFIKATLQAKRNSKKMRLAVNWSSFGRLTIVILVLLAYTFIFPFLGFFFSGFWVLFFLFRDPKQPKWWVSLFEAGLTVIVGYFLFSVFLQNQFPQGPWGIK